MTLTEIKTRLNKSVDFLTAEFINIRAGRATPNILEDVAVNAYQSTMSIKELGSITVLDYQNLVISPWDKSTVGAIVKAIRESDLNLNPVEDGNVIRVPIPPLTEERRQELVKLASKKAEEVKQAMRNIRQEAMKDIDKDFSEKKIGEDEKFTNREEVEKTVKDFITKIDTLLDEKTKDLLTI